MQRTQAGQHALPRSSLWSCVVLLVCLLTVVSSCRSGVVSNLSNSADNYNQKNEERVKSPLPAPTGFVNDYANIFDPKSEKQLEMVLTELRNRSEIEFAVVTVETTGGQPIFDYSLDVARGWGIGPKDSSKGGGLLLMLAVKDRRWRIQVSESLENDLPDEVCRALGVQSEKLYKRGQYAEGITNYINAIIERLQTIRGFKLDHLNRPA